MELEHRVEMLEREITVLKRDLRERLLDVQRCLSEETLSPSRRRKKAWALALLNILLAITLALLLDHDDRQRRRANWRNAATLLLSGPGLVTAVITMLLPSLWFVIVLTALVIASVNVA